MVLCVGEMSLVWANCHSPLRHTLAKYSCVIYVYANVSWVCCSGEWQFALISICSYFNKPFEYENAKIQKIMINVNNDK